MNGFGHPIAWNRRHTGFVEGELEIDRDKLAIANRRRTEIYSAAAAFVHAHQEVVDAAKRRGFALTALDAELIVPPWKADEEAELRRPRREFSGRSSAPARGPQ